VFNKVALPEIVYKIPIYSTVLYNNVFEWNSIFLFTSFEKTSIRTIWTPRSVPGCTQWSNWRGDSGKPPPGKL